MQEGELLGHIVSKNGITIYSNRVKFILELSLPNHKKELQSVLGRISFLRRFISDIASLQQPLTAMLNKNIAFKWTKEGKEKFQAIKEALSIAQVMVNPYFLLDFVLCNLGIIYYITTILVQKNKDNFEFPIAFFNQCLTDYETRYTKSMYFLW